MKPFGAFWREKAHRLRNAAWVTWFERHPRLTRVVMIVGLLPWVFVMLAPWFTVAVRSDESLPQYRLFLIEKGRHPHRGDYVAFRMRDEYALRVTPHGYVRPYVRVGEWWLKEVYGLEGDRIRVQERDVWINDTHVGTGVGEDRLHQPIELAQFASPIPAGQYYVGLPHRRSFDSKYIGYIHEKDIGGVVIPLW